MAIFGSVRDFNAQSKREMEFTGKGLNNIGNSFLTGGELGLLLVCSLG